jgi:uncharacterized membrane protein
VESLGRAVARVRVDVRGHPVAWAYLVIALTWGLAMALITPPFQVPDEAAHYYRAWSVANAELVAQSRMVVSLPENVASLPDRLGSLIVDWSSNHYSVKAAAGLLWEPISGHERGQVTTAAGYGPIGYLPQALGIDIARLLGHSPLLGFYLGRLSNLLVSSLLVFFAIRIVPFGKPLVALSALLPMFVSEVASLSPDALALSGFLLFLALMLSFSGREALTTVDKITIVCAAIVLLNAKPGLVTLALLVFLVRPRQFGGARNYATWVGATLIASVGLAGVMMIVAPHAAPGYLHSVGLTGVDPGKQLEFMVSHPLGFAKVLYRTFDQQAIALTQAAYGLLGWLTVRLPVLGMYAMGLAGILLLGVRETVGTTRWQRLVMGVTGVVYAGVVSAALYEGWSALWSPVVNGLQGRYFLPVVALALFVVYGVRVQRQRAILLILLAAVVFAAFTTIGTLVRFYY